MGVSVILLVVISLRWLEFVVSGIGSGFFV